MVTFTNFEEKANEVIATCERYGFMEKKVMPYGFCQTVREFTRNWKDFRQFTETSKAIMCDELRGFLPILEAWVKLEDEPKVMVYLTNKGITKVYPKSIALELMDDELGVIVG